MLELWSLSLHLISKALKWKGENCHQGIEQITTKNLYGNNMCLEINAM